MDKKDLRKKARAIRNSLDMEKTSEGIVKNILKCEQYNLAKNVMIFYPLKHEVNLLSLLEKSPEKTFYLPKVDGENLLVCPYKKGDSLTISDFKTLEPETKPINPDLLDIIFVPALMIDKDGYRLGYGGGFYDKFLSKYARNAVKITAIPSELVIEKLPFDDFDEKIDVTICEK